MRNKTPISVLIIDLDRFKDYNDIYGHIEGDKMLQAVAQTLKQELKRSVDFIARWGGEEFVALLANTACSSAMNIAEQIRQSVENVQILLANKQATKITISIGVNTQIPTVDSSIDDFIRYADDALYSAKKGGRNMVCRYKDN